VRIVVVGTSGSGKTTLATAIANGLAIPHIELDALNWEAGWRSVIERDPEAFKCRVAQAVAAERWVCDGNYSLARGLVWGQATHLVWLDYERRVVMARVIRRSFIRALRRTELWAGNQEEWRRMLRPSHPISWAWTTWRRKRETIGVALASADYAHLTTLRLRHPREAAAVVPELRRMAAAGTGA
jgi:adenylate kinase family enzyme